MVVVLDPRRPRPYVPRSDEHSPPELRTTFQVRGLTAREAAYVKDIETFAVHNGIVGEVRVGVANFHRVALGVVGWTNLLGEDRRPVEFKQVDGEVGGRRVKLVHDEGLDLLPDALVTELALQVVRLTQLTEVDSKSPAPGGAAGVGQAADVLQKVSGP